VATSQHRPEPIDYRAVGRRLLRRLAELDGAVDSERRSEAGSEPGSEEAERRPCVRLADGLRRPDRARGHLALN